MARIIKHKKNDELKLLLEKINSFFDYECNAYMGIGGIGDLLLVLALCYDQKNPKILFLANDPDNKLTLDLLKFFNVEFLIHRNLFDSSWINFVYNHFKNLPCYRSSAHTPDNLRYDDWVNIEKYIPRIKTNTNWDKLINTKRWFKEKYVVICPSGSTKATNKKRYLSHEEYKTIILKFLQYNYKIITTSHESDISLYGLFPNKNCMWMTNEKIIQYNGSENNININDFLQIIYNSDDCISMDTYLKTLILLLNKEVKVIQTKYDGEYNNHFIDPSDKIFLNQDIWPKLKIYKHEDLLSELDNCLK